MTIKLILNHGQIEQVFPNVEGLTFHPDHPKTPFECWTKYQEEGRGSEELVNINPALVKISDITIIQEELCVFGRLNA